jgi:membrane protease YdiL (CAAX protease family)
VSAPPTGRGPSLPVALLAVVACSLVLAAATAPVLYEAILRVVPTTRLPFSRVFDRVALAAALVLVVALRRAFPFAAAWRLVRADGWGVASRRVALGVVLAATSTLAALPLVVASGRLGWSVAGLARPAVLLVSALPAALLVSLLEEGFFRALVFRGLRARIGAAGAALASSALYALAHVVSPDHRYVPPDASPAAGLAYLATLGERVLAPASLATALGLVLIGLVLALALERTGSFALCVGLHAGWFAAAKVAILATTSPAGLGAAGSAAKRALFLSHPAVLAAILVVGVVILAVPRRRTAGAATAA